LTSKCILVVDDSPDICMFIKSALTKRGYIVFVAENGKEALQKLDILEDVHRPCLILCDLNMPVMDGWQFIEAIGKINELISIPLVVHSSELNKPTKYESLDKPASIEELMRVVERHCGKPTTDCDGGTCV